MPPCPGDRWFVDETYVKVSGRWTYLYRAIDQHGQVAFSPDGRTLAAASDDDKVWLWNITSPAHTVRTGQPLTGPTSRVGLMAFSPDGHTLTVGANDDMIWSWNLNLSQVIKRICATTSGNLTPGQWTGYIPQLPYDPPCRRS